MKVLDAAETLARRSRLARACTVCLPLPEVQRLTIDARLQHGCRLAIYDALAEACQTLDGLLGELGPALADGEDEDIVARRLEVRQRRLLRGNDAATECGESAEEPASHGAASGPRD